MVGSTLGRLTLASALALLAAGAASAVQPEVRDDAGLFKPDAVRQANAILQDIKAKYGKEVLVETVKEVPEEDQKRAKHMTDAARKKYFAALARDRAQLYSVGLEDGIYVLICKNPPYCTVLPGAALREHLFTDDDAEYLCSKYLNPQQFRWGKLRDRLLLQGLGWTRDVLGQTTSGPPPESRLGGLAWVVGILAALVGLWVVMGMLRAVLAPRAGTPLAGPSPAGAAGGAAPQGGFFQRTLSSLFGATLGFWIYKLFFSWQSRHAADSGAAAPATLREEAGASRTTEVFDELPPDR
jgi:hypothetical protein